MNESERIWNTAASVPMRTSVVEENPSPEIWTGVPATPWTGLKEVMLGAAANAIDVESNPNPTLKYH